MWQKPRGGTWTPLDWADGTDQLTPLHASRISAIIPIKAKRCSISWDPSYSVGAVLSPSVEWISLFRFLRTESESPQYRAMLSQSWDRLSDLFSQISKYFQSKSIDSTELKVAENPVSHFIFSSITKFDSKSVRYPGSWEQQPWRPRLRLSFEPRLSLDWRKDGQLKT